MHDRYVIRKYCIICKVVYFKCLFLIKAYNTNNIYIISNKIHYNVCSVLQCT